MGIELFEANHYKIIKTKSFLEDVSNLPNDFQIQSLNTAIELLKDGKSLNKEYDYHVLKGRRAGKICIHIPDSNAYTEDESGNLNSYSDWQLFFDKDENRRIIVLEETGTHEYLRIKTKTSGKKR